MLKYVRWLNMIAFVIMLVMNALANALPLNGKTTGEIAAALPVLFTPAAYAFSIWGLIYLLLLGFVVYQNLPAQRYARFIEQIGLWFVISCVANSLWLVAWHHERFLLTMLCMLVLLTALLVIYYRLRIGDPARQIHWHEYWCVHLPFSVYLGWITVATLANFAVVLHTLHLDNLGLSPVGFTTLLIFSATGVALFMIPRRTDIGLPLVIAWALAAIAVRHWPALPMLAGSAGFLACDLLVFVYIFRRKRQAACAVETERPNS